MVVIICLTPILVLLPFQNEFVVVWIFQFFLLYEWLFYSAIFYLFVGEFQDEKKFWWYITHLDRLLENITNFICQLLWKYVVFIIFGSFQIPFYWNTILLFPTFDMVETCYIHQQHCLIYVCQIIKTHSFLNFNFFLL